MHTFPSPLELSKWIHFTLERQNCNRRIGNVFSECLLTQASTCKSSRSYLLSVPVTASPGLSQTHIVFCLLDWWVRMSLYERVWLDDQPVLLPTQTCPWLFSAADHHKIRLKGIWRQVCQPISLPNPWWWLSNSCHLWWKFTVVALISDGPGICWK